MNNQDKIYNNGVEVKFENLTDRQKRIVEELSRKIDAIIAYRIKSFNSEASRSGKNFWSI